MAEVNLRVRSDYLLVRRTAKPARTASGIALPDTAPYAAGEGTVLSTGPGLSLGDGRRAFVWYLEGDLILFPPYAFRPLEGRWGLVAAADVVATVEPETDVLFPENDWVLVDPDRGAAATAGGIALPEGARTPPRSGVLRDFGPGLPRAAGPLAGCCKPLFAVLNVPQGLLKAQPRVYWAADAVLFHARDQALVRAGDLIAYEEGGHESF